MKKVLLIVAALCITLSGAFAQTAEEIQASGNRIAKLESQKTPENCALYNIDELARQATELKDNSVKITPMLLDLYYRSMGQNSEGVADASVQKPALQVCIDLSKKIEAQVKATKEASDNISKAKDELKSASMKQKMKASKSLNYSMDVLPIVTEETAFQTKVIAAVIASLSK